MQLLLLQGFLKLHEYEMHVFGIRTKKILHRLRCQESKILSLLVP